MTSLDELLERQADDALGLSGARGSAWNGHVGWMREDGRAQPRAVVGVADWDGTIYYDTAYVQRPLLALFEKGDGLDAAELSRAKNALAVVLHENCHLLASDPRHHQITRALWSWPLAMLEEGSTELFTHTRLNAYLRRLGLDQVVPALPEVQVEPSYPLFVPAVRTLTRGAGRLTRQPGPEVLRKVICEAGGRKFHALGDIVLEGSGLAARMPAGEREAGAAEIADAVRRIFGEVARMGSFLTPATSNQVSRRVGRDALREILLEVEKLDARYPEGSAPGQEPAPLRLDVARSPSPARPAPLEVAARIAPGSLPERAWPAHQAAPSATSSWRKHRSRWSLTRPTACISE